MKKQQLRYVYYGRKSTEDTGKQIQSIGDQTDWAEEKARAEKLTLMKPYFTEEKSAKKPNVRPTFEAMLQFIEAGKADAILCWKTDRLSRNPVDSARVQWLLQQGVIKSILTADREYLPEDNALLWAVEAGLNNQFIRDLRANTKRGIASKVRKGQAPFMAPLGYLNEKAGDKGNKRILVDKRRWGYMRRIFDLMLTGFYNPNEILEIITREGLRTRKTKMQGGSPVTQSGIYRILTNVFYTGQFWYNGELYEGKHEPMITMIEFDHIQLLLGNRGKPRPQKHEFAYTGIIKCGECGCSITAETKRKFIKTTRQVKEFTYYRCTKKRRQAHCKQRPISLKDLEAQIEPTVSGLSILPEFKDWALKVLADDNKYIFAYRAKLQKSLRKKITEMERELYDLNKTYTRGKLDDDFYTAEKKDLKAKLRRLRKDLADSETTAEKQIHLSENVFKFACNARERFMTGNIQTKREILAALSARFELTDGKLVFTPHKWIQILTKEYPQLEAQLQEARTKEFQTLQLESLVFRQIYEKWGHTVRNIRTALTDGPNALTLSFHLSEHTKHCA